LTNWAGLPFWPTWLSLPPRLGPTEGQNDCWQCSHPLASLCSTPTLPTIAACRPRRPPASPVLSSAGEVGFLVCLIVIYNPLRCDLILLASHACPRPRNPSCSQADSATAGLLRRSPALPLCFPDRPTTSAWCGPAQVVPWRHLCRHCRRPPIPSPGIRLRGAVTGLHAPTSMPAERRCPSNPGVASLSTSEALWATSILIFFL
jgi:hypothetical protein